MRAHTQTRNIQITHVTNTHTQNTHSTHNPTNTQHTHYTKQKYTHAYTYCVHIMSDGALPGEISVV